MPLTQDERARLDDAIHAKRHADMAYFCGSREGAPDDEKKMLDTIAKGVALIELLNELTEKETTP